MTSKQLIKARDEKIAEVVTLTEQLDSLVGKKDKASEKARLSTGAKKANRNREIREIERELAAEHGEFVEPYVSQRTRVSREPRSAEQLQASIDRNWAAFQACPFEATKASLDQAISSLVKAAAKHDVKVNDPR